MRKGKMMGKIFGIALVLAMIASTLGGLAAASGIALAEEEYYATREEAVSYVPIHVVPKDCFVWKDGPDPAKPWRVIPGTGCAHWVAHELGLGIFPSPWQRWEMGEIEPPLPPEAWQVCYDGFYIRVADVIDGRIEVEIKDAKVGDIWTNDDLTHTGIVRQVGDDRVLVEHDSSSEGGVVQTWFSSGKCWRGLEVVCVPWRGDEDLPHPTWDGKEVTLKGTVRYAGDIEYTWDFGDGSSTESGTATTTDEYPFPISTRHTYTGATGTMYVARLTVTAGVETRSDTYLVTIEDETRKASADVGVDEGLWWLYRQQNRYSSDGVDLGYWQTSYRVAHTGAAVQAFENNGHKPFGEPTKDPYVDCVRRGLNYLTAMMHKAEPIPADDGDTNGNGFGISCYHDDFCEMYEIGMAMMALVSSDTPGRVAVTGPEGVIGRTYEEIIQDMADFCAYAQNDDGGWRYYRNYGASDNSVTQWPIIGMEPAEAKWGITIADFVRQRLMVWLPTLQYTANPADWRYGGFDYQAGWDWYNIAKTAGTGMPGYVFCGMPIEDERIQIAINFIDTNWATDNFGNGYAMYAVMKAFEEFLDRESTGNHIWWDEYVDYLIPVQRADGYWDAMGYSQSPQLTTAWMVMILTKVVYDIPPTAVAKADGFDEIGVDKGQNVNFDGSQSREGTYEIVKYEWDWDSDGIYDAEGVTGSHTYSDYGTYTVTLRVTDNRDIMTGGEKPAMTDTDTCIVHVHLPPHPPIAHANGPYIGWVGAPVTLDGSGSWDPNEPPFGNDEVISWHWDLDNDGEFDDAFGETAAYSWNEPGIYPIALMVDSSEEPCWSEEPSRTTVEIGNHDPVADIGGPYETAPCTPVTLDGYGSYDPDESVGDRIVSYEWDLDNDGEYDDAFVVSPEFHREAEGVYTIRLKVTDTFGATDTDWTTVTVKEKPSEFWVEVNRDGACIYDREKEKDIPDLSRPLKCLPAGWVLRRSTEDGKPIEGTPDGIRWFNKVEDVTDGTIGWLEKGDSKEGGNKEKTKLIIFENNTEISGDFSFNKNSLKCGEYSTDTRYLQVILKHEGFFPAGQSVTDGYFNKTRKAVEQFQKKYKLDKQDGIVDDETVEKLNEILEEKCTLNHSRVSIAQEAAIGLRTEFLPEDFPIELVLAMILQESWPEVYHFDNEFVRSDWGRGIMQLTTDYYVGAGSGVRCYDNRCITREDKNDCKCYYTNTAQGIEANIKDGLNALKHKYVNRCCYEVAVCDDPENQGETVEDIVIRSNSDETMWMTVTCETCISCKGTPCNAKVESVRWEWDDDKSMTITCQEFKRLDAVWGYNGYGETYLIGEKDSGIVYRLRHLGVYFGEGAYDKTKAENYAKMFERIDNTGFVITTIKSPGELRVYDSEGRVTGLVDGEVRDGLLLSSYDEASARL